SESTDTPPSSEPPIRPMYSFPLIALFSRPSANLRIFSCPHCVLVSVASASTTIVKRPKSGPAEARTTIRRRLMSSESLADGEIQLQTAQKLLAAGRGVRAWAIALIELPRRRARCSRGVAQPHAQLVAGTHADETHVTNGVNAL